MQKPKAHLRWQAWLEEAGSAQSRPRASTLQHTFAARRMIDPLMRDAAHVNALESQSIVKQTVRTDRRMRCTSFALMPLAG
jgi:hypothetical protein